MLLLGWGFWIALLFFFHTYIFRSFAAIHTQTSLFTQTSVHIFECAHFAHSLTLAIYLSLYIDECVCVYWFHSKHVVRLIRSPARLISLRSPVKTRRCIRYIFPSNEHENYVKNCLILFTVFNFSDKKTPKFTVSHIHQSRELYVFALEIQGLGGCGAFVFGLFSHSSTNTQNSHNNIA